jgi:hypothetical protein
VKHIAQRGRIRSAGATSRSWRALSSTRLRQTRALALGLAVIVGLAGVAEGLTDFWRNFALNTSADLLGATITIYMITPIIGRRPDTAIREHPRLDYSQFLAHANRAEHVISILDADFVLLLEPHARRFKEAISAAFSRGVLVQVLVTDPASRAEGTSEYEEIVVIEQQIMRDLHFLREHLQAAHSYRGRHGLMSESAFEIRLCSVLPTMFFYRCDENALVSLMPTNHAGIQPAHLQVSINSPIGEHASRYFDVLWRASKPMQLDSHRQGPASE